MMPAQAQLLAVKPSEPSKTLILTPEKNNWAIFTDVEKKMIYIDFEKIPVNVSEVSVRDANNKILFRDPTVWELPVNTIYEVDFVAFPKGDYALELRSFTGAITKRQITLK
jgi:NACalpha-BTF3-like transcription factor